MPRVNAALSHRTYAVLVFLLVTGVFDFSLYAIFLYLYRYSWLFLWFLFFRYLDAEATHEVWATLRPRQRRRRGKRSKVRRSATLRRLDV